MKIEFSNITFKVQVGEEPKIKLVKVKGKMFKLPKYSKRKFVVHRYISEEYLVSDYLTGVAILPDDFYDFNYQNAVVNFFNRCIKDKKRLVTIEKIEEKFKVVNK